MDQANYQTLQQIQKYRIMRQTRHLVKVRRLLLLSLPCQVLYCTVSTPYSTVLFSACSSSRSMPNAQCSMINAHCSLLTAYSVLLTASRCYRGSTSNGVLANAWEMAPRSSTSFPLLTFPTGTYNTVTSVCTLINDTITVSQMPPLPSLVLFRKPPNWALRSINRLSTLSADSTNGIKIWP
jgi:hypothetical protein